MSEKIKVLIVGFGQIGRRHFESLLVSDQLFFIDVIDNVAEKQELFDQDIQSKSKDNNFRFKTNLKDVANNSYDIAIVATDSKSRFEIIQYLLDNIYCQRFILEKVVFVNVHEYEEVIKKISNQDKKCWVNTAKRYFPVFKKIQSLCATTQPSPLEVSIHAGGLGLACNSIHFLDLLTFWRSSTLLDLSVSKVSVRESKRDGFYDLSGRLEANFSCGSSLRILDVTKSMPWSIMVTTEEFNLTITEGGQRAMCYYSSEKNWINEQFCVPFQSNLTADIVDEIISTGNCSLASLNEVFQIDKYLLPLFRNEIEKYLGVKLPNCPIT